ncbi:MAG: NnrU family protein, partial [Alphaproteobacteria bacterium]|nr:NnrU family protein [Alphaproteobacteria bacterium]
MGTADDLFFATALFVLLHFLLSSNPIRERAKQKIGNSGFKAIYSIAVLVPFVWMITAYGEALYHPIWEPPLMLRSVAGVLMIP